MKHLISALAITMLFLGVQADAITRESAAQAKPFEVKVLVLNFDPIIPS